MATRVWGGGTGPVDGDWNTATNWTGDVAPANGDDVVFDTTDFTPCSVPNSSPLTLNSLTFDGYQDGGGYWGGSPPAVVLATFFDIIPYNLYITETFGNGQYSGVIRCDISGGATFGTWEIPAAFMTPVYLSDNSGTALTYDLNWTSLAPCASADYDQSPPALGWLRPLGGGTATYRFNYPEEEVVYFRSHMGNWSNLSNSNAFTGGNIVFNKPGLNAKIISQNYDNGGSNFAPGRSWLSKIAQDSAYTGVNIFNITINCAVLTVDLKNVLSSISTSLPGDNFSDFTGSSVYYLQGGVFNATTKILITGLSGSELFAAVSGATTYLTLNTPIVEVRNSANVFRITNGNSYYAPGSSIDSSSAGGSITCSGILNFYDQSTFSGGIGPIGNYYAGFMLFDSFPTALNLYFYDESICLAYIEPGAGPNIFLYGSSKYLTASTSIYSFTAPNYTIYWGQPFSLIPLNNSGSSF